MTPATPPRRPRAPKALFCLVMAAHLGVLLVLGHALRPHDHGPGRGAVRPLWLRLLPEPAAPVDVEVPRHQRPAERQARPAAPTRAVPAPPMTDRGPATAAPAAEAISTPPVDAAANGPVAARPPEPPASRPLDLRAPTSAVRQAPSPASLAREDPRANTSRLGSEERMARAIGTDQTLHEAVMPDGTRSFRRGRDCVIARPARESQLNPYNQSINPTPRSIDSC